MLATASRPVRLACAVLLLAGLLAAATGAAFADPGAPPPLVVTAPAGPLAPGDPVTGTAPDVAEVDVDFTAGGLTSTAKATPAADGAWSVPAPAAGTYTVTARQGTETSLPVTITVATLTFDAPLSPTLDTTPTFTGRAAGPVTVTTAAPDRPGTSGEATVTDGKWTFTPAAPLPAGQLTVTATSGEESVSHPLEVVVVDFAATEAYLGGTAQVTATPQLPGVKYHWEPARGAQGTEGSPTARFQLDTLEGVDVTLEAEGPGGSQTVTHRVKPTNRPPTVAIDGPASATIGNPVALHARASDPDGQPVAVTWSLDGGEACDDATGLDATVTFAQAGPHRVKACATDGEKLADPAFASVTVLAPPAPPAGPPSTPGAPAPTPKPKPKPKPAPRDTPVPTLLRPFPVVRVAGTLTSTGARISVLSVRAPRGATVRARCRGRGCPRQIAAIRVRRTGTVRVHALERRLGAGAVIEVLVTRRGRIGKYARITIRKGRGPGRSDRCLAPNGRSPVACPAG